MVVITVDAMDTQTDTASRGQVITAGGGEYVFTPETFFGPW